MNFQVSLTPDFEGQFKRLAKKYRSLPHDLSTLISSLSNDSNQGVALGSKLFKIRMNLSSKGKSGGTRVITFVVVNQKSLFDCYLRKKRDRQPNKRRNYLFA